MSQIPPAAWAIATIHRDHYASKRGTNAPHTL